MTDNPIDIPEDMEEDLMAEPELENPEVTFPNPLDLRQLQPVQCLTCQNMKLYFKGFIDRTIILSCQVCGLVMFISQNHDEPIVKSVSKKEVTYTG